MRRHKSSPVGRMIKDLILETERLHETETTYHFAQRNLYVIDFLLNNIDQQDYNKLWLGPEYFPLIVKHFAKKMSDMEYWQFISRNYVMYNLKVHFLPESAFNIFKSKRPERHYLMSKRAKTYFNSLPEILTIYRGMSVLEYDAQLFRYSWTLSKKVATFFAGKYHSGQDCVVVCMQVEKSKVIAYFESRNENLPTIFCGCNYLVIWSGVCYCLIPKKRKLI